MITLFDLDDEIFSDPSYGFDKFWDSINLLRNNMREKNTGELRIYQIWDSMASFADCKSAILDISNAFFAEYGMILPIETFEILFQLFEKGGAMKISKSK